MQFQPKDGPGIDQGTDSETDPDAAEPEAPAVEQDYVLFRFFDMFVEPGKTYAYRVQLVLYNPNHGLAPRYLADPKLSAEQFLLTEWSQPSPPVEVPYDVSVLAEKVSPPTVRSGGKDRFRTEPGGRVGAVVWDNANAIEVVQDVPVSRGTWANHRSTIETVDPLDGKPLKLEDYELKTDHLVVDLRSDALPSLLGGKWREDRDLTSPGEMLLLNDRGELIVRSEVEGAAAVARRQEKSAPKDPGEFGDPAFPAPGRDPFGQPPPEERGDTVDRFSPFGGGPSKDEKGPRRRR